MKARNRTARTLAGAASVAALSVGLVACSTDQTKEQSDPKAPAQSAEGSGGSAEGLDDGSELTMWTRAPLERQAKNAVDAYNASHSNQVRLEIIPNDDVEGKVGAAIQTQSLPCILAGDVVRVPYWTQQGVFMDLTDRIDSMSNIDDIAVGHIEAGTYEGAKHTLPFVTDISVLVWNKDLYEKAGLDPERPPTNMTEFVEHAKAVAALNEPGVAGTYFPGQSGGAVSFMMFPSIWADGENVVSEDGRESLMDNPSSVGYFEAIRELAETENGLGAGSKEETGATWVAPFQEGKIGLMPYPFTVVAEMYEGADFEVGVAGIPGVEGGVSTFLGGDAIGVSSSCESPDQAWNFMSWLMSEDAQQEVFADNNDTASNVKVLAEGYSKADPRTLAANDTIQYGRTPAAINYGEAFNAPGSPWQLLIQDAVWGDAAKLTEHNDAITAILAQ